MSHNLAMQARDKITSKDKKSQLDKSKKLELCTVNIKKEPTEPEICTLNLKKEPTEDPNTNADPATPASWESINERFCTVCKSEKIPLFRFPQKTDKLKQWLKNLNINHYPESDFPYIKHKGRVCTHHYRRANSMQCFKNKRKLKQSDENAREMIPEPAFPRSVTCHHSISLSDMKLIEIVPDPKPASELKLPEKQISRTACIVCSARRKLVPFPLENKRLKQWLQNLNINHYSEADFPYLKQNAKVCILHFKRANSAMPFRKIAPKRLDVSKSKFPAPNTAEAHENMDTQEDSSQNGQYPANSSVSLRVDQSLNSQSEGADETETASLRSSDAVSSKKLGKSNRNLKESDMDPAQDSPPLQVVPWENINSSFCMVCKQRVDILIAFPQRNEGIKKWLKNLDLNHYPESDYPYIKLNARLCSYHFERAVNRIPNGEEKVLPIENSFQLNQSVPREAINPTFCIICKSKTDEWLFPFPQTNGRLRQWLQNLYLLNQYVESDFPYIKQNARVCSAHFEKANKTELNIEAPQKSLVEEIKNSQVSQKTSNLQKTLNVLSNKNKKSSTSPLKSTSGSKKNPRKRTSKKASCIVCKSMKRRLFAFPKSKNSRMLWMSLLRINREQMSKFENFKRDARVCSLHFDPGAFTSSSERQLHPEALPNTKYPFGIPNRDEDADRTTTHHYSELIDVDRSSSPQSSPSDNDALGDSRLTQDLSYSSRSSNSRTCSTINRKSCIVCKSRRRPLFQFPQKINRMKMWLKSLNMDHYTRADYKYLFLNARCCGEHFDETSFTSSLKRRISCIAVPRLDLPVQDRKSMEPCTWTEVSSSEDETPDYAAILKRLKKDLTVEQFKFVLAQLQVDKIQGESWTPEDICLAVKEYFQTRSGYEFLRRHMSFTLQAYVKRYLEVKDPEYVEEEEPEKNDQREVNSKVSSNSSIPSDLRTCDTINRKSCIVCKTRKKPLFQFPQKLGRMKMWLQYLNMDSEDYTEADFKYISFNARICGAHFHEESFTNDSRSRITCKAVPKLNLGATKTLPVQKRRTKTDSPLEAGKSMNPVEDETSDGQEEAVELSVLKQLKNDLTSEQYRFLLNQLRISKIYGKCRGWTQEEMSFALKLYFQSPLAYQFLRKHVSFPSLSYLKRFPFDDPQLAEFAHGLREEESDLSEDSSGSDLDNDGIPVEASNEEDFPKIMDVKSLYTACEIQPEAVVIKRECLSPEKDKHQMLLSQIQCQIETSHVKLEQLQQRSKKMKQRNTQLPVILMLTAEELTRDS